MPYVVRVDWSGTAGFAGSADDVSQYVQRIGIQRGRDSAFAAFPAGQATIVLRDDDGDWNPRNSASTYNVVPGRPVRVSYLKEAIQVVADSFTGYTDGALVGQGSWVTSVWTDPSALVASEAIDNGDTTWRGADHPTAYADNCAVEVTIKTPAAAGNLEIYALIDNPAQTMVMLGIDSDEVWLGEYDTGTYTGGPSTTVAWKAGDVVRLEVREGVTRAVVNGELLLTWRYGIAVTSGRTGFEVNSATLVFDDYRVLSGGASSPLFTGFVRRFEHQPLGGDEIGRTELECEDAFMLLDSYQPTEGTVTGAAAGSVIGTILDGGGSVLDRVGRSLDSGGDVGQFVANGDTFALSEINSIVAVDLGEFYVARNGTITYTNRDDRYTRAVSGTITDTARGIVPTADLDLIVNRQRASVDGTAYVQADDTTSQEQFGVRSGPTLTSAIFPGSGHAESYCNWIVLNLGSPDAPIGPLRFTAKAGAVAEAGVFAHAYERELGDRLEVIDSVAKIGTADVFIESIQHEIIPGDLHTWTFGVSPKPEVAGLTWDPFIIGTSTLGTAGTAIFVY